MSTTAQRSLLRTALIAFAFADLLVWAAFVLNQWLAVPFWEAWAIGGLLALPATLLAVPLVDALLRTDADRGQVRISGDAIPGTGQ